MTATAGPGVRRVLDAAEAIGGLDVHEGYRGWRMRCPAHRGQSTSSLSLDQDGRGVGIHCFKICPTADIIDALGISWPELHGDYDPRARGRRPPRLRMRVRPGDPPPADDEMGERVSEPLRAGCRI